MLFACGAPGRGACRRDWCAGLALSGGGWRQQFRDADEVVGENRKGEHRFGLGAASNLYLGKPSLRLDPAEHLLDPLAADLADAVTHMMRGAAIDSGFADDAMLADRTIDGDVRRHFAFAQVFDEGGHVVSLVGAKGDAMPRFAAIEDRERGFPFCCSGGMSECRSHGKPVPVLHQDMAHEAQSALAAICLAIEPCV